MKILPEFLLNKFSKMSKTITKIFRDFSAVPNLFKRNLSLYLIEDLYFGREPKERINDDPMYSFYKSFSFHSDKWRKIREKCNNNDIRTRYVLTSFLKIFGKKSLNNIQKKMNNIWKTFFNQERDDKIRLDEDVKEKISDSFPIVSNLIIDIAGIDFSNLTLDEIIEYLPNLIENQKNLPDSILDNFIKSREIAYYILIDNVSEEESLDRNLKDDIIKILEELNLNLFEEIMNEEIIEDLSELATNLNKFKKNLYNLLIPIYFFLESEVSKYKDLKLESIDVETQELLIKWIRKFGRIKFSEVESFKSKVRKMRFIRDLLIKLLTHIRDYYLSFFDYQIIERDFISEIEQGFEAIDTLNSIFSGMGWDLSSGILKNIAVDKIIEYAEIINKIAELKEIAEQLGRFEGSASTKNEWKLKPHSPQEIYNIHFSDDIARTLAVELGKLKHPYLKYLFMANWLDHKLLSYELRGKEKISYEEKEEIKRGPIIICIDTSGSMAGFPENLAKSLALAVIKIGHKERRDIHIILFSGPGNIKQYSLEQHVFKKPKFYIEEDLDYRNYEKKQERIKKEKQRYYSDVIDILSYSFGGGTDFTDPLEQAKNMLKKPKFKKADILFISDGISFFDKTIEKITEEIKENNARIFTVVIGEETSIIKEFSDFIYFLPPKLVIQKPNISNRIGKLLKEIKISN